MKRIIDGLTYNTDTATLVAVLGWTEEAGYGTPEIKHRDVLYVTKGGAFFLVEKRSFNKKLRGDSREIEDVDFFAMTRDQAVEWTLKNNGVEIIDDAILGEPPEAEAEKTTSSTLYVRLPTPLKSRIEKDAEDDRLSVNAWVMRCVERCTQLDRVGGMLGEIMQTAQSYASGCTSEMSDMIEHMGQQAEDIALILGWSGKDLEDLCITAGIHACEGISGHRRWPHNDELID